MYIEALNHDLLTHAMTVSCCKSVDFLLGFIVGNASDNMSTRWGRRKPWIVVCFPLAIVSMFFLVWPFPFAADAISPADPADMPCGGIKIDSKNSCPELKACLDEMIGNGTKSSVVVVSHAFEPIALYGLYGGRAAAFSVFARCVNVR